MIQSRLCVLWLLGVMAAPVHVAYATPSKRIQAPGDSVFQLQWWKPVVRTGLERTSLASFGAPALFPSYGSVLVATSDGDVLALRISDGQQLWRVKHGTSFESGVTRVEYLSPHKTRMQGAFVASRDGTVLFLDPSSGRTLWTAQIEGEVRAGPVVHEGRLFVTTHHNRIVVLDVLQGTELWTQARTGPMGLSIEGHARPCVWENHVFVAYSDGTLCAYNVADGALEWTVSLGESFSDTDTFTDLDADPLVLNNTLFAASYRDGLYALNPYNGAVLWHQKTSGITALASDAQRLITVSSEGSIKGWSPDDGSVLYHVRMQPQSFSRIHIEGPWAVASTSMYGLVVWQAANGKPVQTRAVLGEGGSDVHGLAGMLTFVSKTGHLYFFTQK